MCFVPFEIQKKNFLPSFRINTYECHHFLGQDNFVYIPLVLSLKRQGIFLLLSGGKDISEWHFKAARYGRDVVLKRMI